MIKKIMSKEDLKNRLFYVFSITAILANTFGFIANAFIYGFSFGTIICLIFALLILGISILGKVYNKVNFAINSILILINIFEFPYLFLTYGYPTMIYMILGIVGILVFTKKYYRMYGSIAIVVLDIVAIILKALINIPFSVESDNIAIMSSTIASFLIVSISIISLLILLIVQYEVEFKKREELQEKLIASSNIDALTGIYNRRYLSNYLEDLMKKKEIFTIILIDLDDFKQVNDQYGHVFGDKTLMRFAEILKNNILDSGIVTRFGGEEFMLVIKGDNLNQIKEMIAKIREEYINYSINEVKAKYTFSAGIDVYKNEEKLTTLFNLVDKKLYFAKNNGKDQIVF